MTTIFSFTGRTWAGEAVSGERVAESVDAAVAALRQDRILVTKIGAVSSSRGSQRQAGKLGRRVRAKGLAIFTRQFSVMVDSGLPLVECLEILGQQGDDPNLAKTIRTVRTAVEGGSGLAEAMRQHPRTFDRLFTSMIEAGEAGGVLDTILDRLATFIEKNARLRSQVTSAMIYPAAVLVIAAMVVAIILWQVIPTFASLFDGLGAVLPAPTRFIMWLSETFLAWFPIAVAAIAGTALALRRYYGVHRGRRAIDGLLLGSPVVGVVLQKVAVARVCRTLATLLGSGVPILEGLEITAKTAGNAVIENAVMLARDAIEGGQSVATPLRGSGVFPAMVTQMVHVGEASGTLDAMLEKIAEFYEDDVDSAVNGMLGLLEPVMMAFLGVVVGSIVIAMYLPVFDLISRMAG